MFLEPKKFKYKKVKKGKLVKLEFKTNKLIFGTVGLKAVNSGLIHARHIEACRQAISRKIKRKGKLWIRIFPDLPVTSKPIESRMGKGKGSISHWAVKVRGGTVLFEVCGIRDQKLILNALKTGGCKLPVKTKIFK
jgi:large subunit ribosomal protein L16